MKTSLKNRIITWLERYNDWIAKERLVEIVKDAYNKENRGITSEYINRTLRDLASDYDREGRKKPNGREINVNTDKGYAEYAPITKEKPKQYKIIYEPVRKPDGRMVAVPKKVEV